MLHMAYLYKAAGLPPQLRRAIKAGKHVKVQDPALRMRIRAYRRGQSAASFRQYGQKYRDFAADYEDMAAQAEKRGIGARAPFKEMYERDIPRYKKRAAEHLQTASNYDDDASRVIAEGKEHRLTGKAMELGRPLSVPPDARFIHMPRRIKKSYYQDVDPGIMPKPVNAARRVKGQPRLNRNVVKPESLGFKPITAMDDKQRRSVKDIAERATAQRKQDSYTVGWGKRKRTMRYRSSLTPMRRAYGDVEGTVHRWAASAKKYPGKVHWADEGDVGPTFAAEARRVGGKNTGRSFVIGNKAILESKTKAFRNDTFRHEQTHAAPKRSAWRLASIAHDPDRLAREEARAVHGSGVPLFGRKERPRRFLNSPYDKLAAMGRTHFSSDEYMKHREALDTRKFGKPGLRTRGFLNWAKGNASAAIKL